MRIIDPFPEDEDYDHEYEDNGVKTGYLDYFVIFLVIFSGLAIAMM